MHLSRLLSLGLLVGGLGYANTISGQPCAESSALSVYLAPSASFPSGCDVGPLNYTFLDFGKLTARPNGGYSFNSDGGIVNADNLFVVPVNDGDRFGITFRSDSFRSDFSSGPEIYFISYTVDPPPILAGEEVSLDSGASLARFLVADSAAPSVTVREYLCPDNLFVRLNTSPDRSANQCALGPGSATTNPLELVATLDKPFDSVRFANGVPLVSVHLFIELSGNLRNSSFTGVSSLPIVEQVPEPFTVGLTGAGLALMVGLLRRRSPM